jgi:hypothetical protein
MGMVDSETGKSKWEGIVSQWTKLVDGAATTKEPKASSSISFSQFKVLMANHVTMDTEDLKMMFKMYVTVTGFIH